MEVVYESTPTDTHPAAVPAGMYIENLGRDELTKIFIGMADSVPETPAAQHAKYVILTTLEKVLNQQPVTHLEILGLAWILVDLNKFLRLEYN